MLTTDINIMIHSIMIVLDNKFKCIKNKTKGYARR